MGLRNFILTCTIKIEGDECNCVFEDTKINDRKGTFVNFCGDQTGNPLGPGYTDIADGTLRIEQADPYDIEKFPLFNSTIYRRPQGGFLFNQMLGYRSFSKIGMGIFHLVLPKNHLPDPDTISPTPNYSWWVGSRFILGWHKRPIVEETYQFYFEEYSENEFKPQAIICKHKIEDSAPKNSPNINNKGVSLLKSPFKELQIAREKVEDGTTDLGIVELKKINTEFEFGEYSNDFSLLVSNYNDLQRQFNLQVITPDRYTTNSNINKSGFLQLITDLEELLKA